MNTAAIFLWVWAAMAANAAWEAYVEGRNAWDKHKLGWKFYYSKQYCITAYHFFLFWVMWPILLTLPLIIFGWDTRLFGVLLSAFLTGIVIEDFLWFVVNPAVKLTEFNEKFASYYPWFRLGKFAIPQYYVYSTLLAIVSWYFLWR